MLQRTEHDNGVITYQSPLLREVGVVHGFSTRVGGVSTGPYASLNLDSLAKGDEADANTNVAENFRRLRRAVGLTRHMRVEMRQVHGGGVWQVPPGVVHPRDCPEADALISADGRQMLLVRVADCVPVLLAGVDGRAVAAIHAGWRGIIAGVVPNAVRMMQTALDAPAGQLVAAIGPCISVDHFEVGEEVAQAFVDAGLGAGVRRDDPHRPHIDLQATVRQQLHACGLSDKRIDGNTCCTFGDAASFFSHRRDQGRTGRLGAVIAPA